MNRLQPLGRSAVRVPLLGFGAAAIGNLYRKVSDADARAAVASALKEGLSYFDTAPHYGFGLSESRLGAVLEEMDPDCRAVISSKVGRLLVPVDNAGGERHGFVDAAPFEPRFDYSYDAVMRSWEDSRKRLRRDRIDILYAHDLGRRAHGEDHDRHFSAFMNGGYRALRELRDGGQVGAIGIGANEWQICEQAMREGEFDVFLLAGRYTLLEQTALDTFLPECTRQDVSVVIGGPHNSGILATGTKGARSLHYDYAPAPPEIIERVRRIEEVSERFGVRLAAAALQFPLGHPQVASVIPGQASVVEVKDTISLFDTRIPAEYWSALKDDGLLQPDAPVAETTP